MSARSIKGWGIINRKYFKTMFLNEHQQRLREQACGHY